MLLGGWVGRFGVLGPDGIAVTELAAFDDGGRDADALLLLLLDDGTTLFWEFDSVGVMDEADEIGAVLERDELLLLGTTKGTVVNGVVFCAVTVAVFVLAEDVTDVGRLAAEAANAAAVAAVTPAVPAPAPPPAGNCTGEDDSFFFFFGGRPGSASLSLESLELESLELDDEESLELLLDEMLPPEGAMSCFAASSAFLAFFLAVPSCPVTS